MNGSGIASSAKREFPSLAYVRPIPLGRSSTRLPESGSTRALRWVISQVLGLINASKADCDIGFGLARASAIRKLRVMVLEELT